MRAGLSCLVACLALCLSIPTSANADPNDLSGGVFIAHAPPSLEYSSGYDWCERYQEVYSISSCEEQNPRIDLDGNLGERSVWYVIAAWEEEKEWCGTEFGFGSFDPAIYSFLDWGACHPNELEISTTNWPGPNEGTAVVATDTQWEGNFQAVYYFVGYAYFQGQIPLGADPAQSFVGFGNCDTPAIVWPAEDVGMLGLFSDGSTICPDQAAGDSTSVRYPHMDDMLEVMFAASSCVRMRGDSLIDLATNALDGVDEALGIAEPYVWKRHSEVSESALDSLHARGQMRWSGGLYNLNNMYRLILSPGMDSWQISESLEVLPGVVYARPVPHAPPSPTVGDYQSLQYYIKPAVVDAVYYPEPMYADSSGFDALYSWSLPGGDGEGVTITDIEKNWNYDHADISKAAGSQIRPLCYPYAGTDHGTAVLGVLVSDNNGWGTTGMSHGANIQTSCVRIVQLGGGSYYDPAGAIAAATAGI